MNEQVTTEAKKEAQAQERDVHDTVEHVRTRAAAAWSSAANALRKPAIGAGVAGAAVLAAGAFLGVTEAALAAVAVYAIFRTLAKHGQSEAETTHQQRQASA